MCACRCLKTVLIQFGCCAGDFDGWHLESKGLGLGNLAGIGVLHVVALAGLGGRVRVNMHGVAWGGFPAAGTRRHGAKTRRIGGGLGAELRKVKIRAGTVALGHGLSELSLGPESVEDNSIDGDAEDFDDDLDDAADEGPVL